MSSTEDVAVHVSLSHYYPYEGIAHAGGGYVRWHLLAVSRMRPIVAFVSSDRSRRLDHERVDTSLQTVVIERPGWGHSLPAKAFRLAARRWDPSSVGFDVRRSFARSSQLREAVTSAQSVEFQFFEECWAVGLAKRWNPSARMVAVMHDVVSQRLERALLDQPVGRWRRGVLSIRLWALQRRERRVLNQFDVVTVFSEKDRQILIDLGVHTDVHVLHVPLAQAHRIGEDRAPHRGNVLFVGAFDRVENSEAALWLLGQIWTHVVAEHPDASLTLAGANPTSSMRDAAAEHLNVRITGFVDDLSDVYRSAAVAVVPLRHGAGVKFKTITSLLWGVPSVSTTVGVEGIPMPDPYILIADQAEAFAEQINRALRGEADKLAFSGREWARNHYSQAAFEADLDMVLNVAKAP